MKNKIKYNKKDFSSDWYSEFEDQFKLVPNPTPFKNLPDGEYLIRGEQKDHAKEYYVQHGNWYLVDVIVKDNGHKMCRWAEYHYFPQLPEKEWNILNKVYSKLSNYWKMCVIGHNLYMQFRETKRNARFSSYKILKEFLDE